MAHIVQIPMSFDFRIRKAKWVEVEGRIVGAGDDLVGWLQLKAELSVNGNTILADVDWDTVPDPNWGRHTELVESDPDNFDGAAQRIFSDFRPRFFVALDESRSRTHGLRYIPNEDRFRTGTYSADAWRLRDDFLKTPSDRSNILAFLNRWGRWTYREYTDLHGILAFQKKIRRALVSPPDEWLSNSQSSLLPDTGSGYPHFMIHTNICENAISATVTLDLLRKVRFRTCSRLDCRQPFQITSRHKRRYCTQYCAHLESLRRNRARLAGRRRQK